MVLRGGIPGDAPRMHADSAAEVEPEGVVGRGEALVLHEHLAEAAVELGGALVEPIRATVTFSTLVLITETVGSVVCGLKVGVRGDQRRSQMVSREILDSGGWRDPSVGRDSVRIGAPHAAVNRWGNGNAGFHVKFTLRDGHRVTVFSTDPKGFVWFNFADFARTVPFANEQERDLVRQRLNEIPGIQIIGQRNGGFPKYSRFPVSALTHQLPAFQDIVRGVISRLPLAED